MYSGAGAACFTAYKNDFYLLPEQLGVQAGILHLTALRAELTGSTQEPADSICVKVEGTFNGEPYLLDVAGSGAA